MSAWFICIPPYGAARAVAYEAAAAFERRGISHKTFDSLAYDTAFRKLLKSPNDDLVVDLINQAFIVQCLDFGATHCCIMALSPITLFSLLVLKKTGVHTVHWFYEDYRRARYWRDVLAGYDTFCAIQHGPIPDACRQSGVNFDVIQTAASSACLAGSSGTRTHDVVFVGIPTPYRIEVLHHLLEGGIGLSIAGHGWDSYTGPLGRAVLQKEWLSAQDTASLLRTARVGINMSGSAPAPGDADVHLSPRVYDVLACGASLVTEDVAMVHEALAGCFFRTFANKEDALAQVRESLARYDQEARQREENRRIILESHTYDHRIGALCALAGIDSPLTCRDSKNLAGPAA